MNRQFIFWWLALVSLLSLGACGRQPEGIRPAAVVREDLSAGPTQVAISPDGKLLAIGQSDGTVTLFDTRTWSRGAVFKAEPHPIQVLAFSPEGQRLVASSGFTAHVWDVERRKELANLDHNEVYVTSAVFSSDGKRLLTTTASNDGRLWSWDIESKSRKCVFSINNSAILPANTFPCICRASTIDTKSFALDLGPGVLVYDLANSKEVKHLYRNEAVQQLRYSPDGKQLAVALHQRVVLLDTRDWTPVTECRIPDTPDPVWDLCFTPDGTTLFAVVSAHNTAPSKVCLFNAATGELVAAVSCHPKPAMAVCASPDGKWVATAGLDDAVKIWDLAALRKAGVQK